MTVLPTTDLTVAPLLPAVDAPASWANRQLIRHDLLAIDALALLTGAATIVAAVIGVIIFR